MLSDLDPCVASEFVFFTNRLADELHANSRAHGFWNDVEEIENLLPESLQARFHAMMLGEKCALAHSEISEALEVIRKDPNAPDRDCPEFTALEIEHADTIIRILEVGAHEGHRIAEAIVAKARFNRNRPFKHGKMS